MRVLVYEYACAVADRIGLPASIRAEGAAMLAAIRSDLAQVAGVETFTLEPGEDECAALHAAAAVADYVLLIAPEFDDLLLQRCRWVEEAGGRLLGPSAAAVQLTGDKLTLAACLRERGIPTPPCQQIPSPEHRFPWPLVLKPRFGAGSQATFLVRAEADLPRCLETARAAGWNGEVLVQPFCPGTAASVAFLIGPESVVPLLPAWQRLSGDGRFRYLGGGIPLPPALADRSIRIARQAVAAIAGLRGYVGVDLVLGMAADSQDCVIEINPRLTTSYVGLRALARTNLAEAMLRIVQGQPVEPIAWHPGTVAFQPDGTIEISADPALEELGCIAKLY